MRTADSLQVIWQAKFQETELNPFVSYSRESNGIRYQRLDNPAFWWHNPTNPNSLRLTTPAYKTLQKQTKIPTWTFKLDHMILPKTLLQLEKHFTSPYYIHAMKTLIVYGEQEAMMLALHGSDLQQYLDNQD